MSRIRSSRATSRRSQFSRDHNRKIRHVFFLVVAAGCTNEGPRLSTADYGALRQDETCRGLKFDKRFDSPEAPPQLQYAVRAPQNFDPLVRHPLLVVFPPAGHNSRRSEAFSNFTELATARGFIVLYPEHRRLSLQQMKRLRELVKHVAGEWCVDKTRIFFTGHSDGGTAAHVSVQQQDLAALRPAKIAPSAAGVRPGDMTDLGCHHRLPVMIMHNRNDELFPDFGTGMRDWWLECNQCSDTFDRDDDGCETYRDCRQGNTVRFCELPGGHRQWNQDRSAILDFLLDI